MVKKPELRGKRRKKGIVEAVVNRGAWTAEEDHKLMQYVKAHGDKNWRSLPAKAGLNRCGKSCRLRWLNYLRPGIKRGNISDDEEDLIIRLHNLLGNRWSLIAGRLPGRTDNEIKNHWNTHLCRRSVTIHDLNLRLNQKNTVAATCRQSGHRLMAPASSHEFNMIDPAVLVHAHGEDGHSTLDSVTAETLQYILSPDVTELYTEERQLVNLVSTLNGTSSADQFGRGNFSRGEDLLLGHLEISEAHLEGCHTQSWDVLVSDYFTASENIALCFTD